MTIVTTGVKSVSELELKDLYSGFRDPNTIKALAWAINEEAKKLKEPLKIMEVCGGHTHTIMKYGLKQLLPDTIDFIHGGDMIRVPGSESSLAVERAKGYDIRALYSPLDAIKIAEENPDKKVIFFAIGFETTTPMTAAVLEQMEKRGIKNLFFHINHVLVPPAVDAIMADGQAKINAFIGPAHVSVITGAKIYKSLPEQYATPVVVSGFEPVDVMQSILMIVKQKNEDRADMEIQYSRSVTLDGNTKAQKMIDKFMKPREHFRWRGIGDIPLSALELREEYAAYDAEKIFADILPTEPIDDHKLCICGTILKGLAKPNDCKVFGTACTPNTPMGSCMVSSEGACNAYYRYGEI
jgi:hydrogenase expression/formation protein HypD